MIFIPALFLLLIAILFPRFARFVFTLAAFGVLFVIASCIDHARAQTTTPRAALQRCLSDYAQLNAGEIVKAKAFGGDSSYALAQMCSGYMGSYIFQCEQAGNSTAQCYSFVKDDAQAAIATIAP